MIGIRTYPECEERNFWITKWGRREVSPVCFNYARYLKDGVFYCQRHGKRRKATLEIRVIGDGKVIVRGL